MIEAPIKLQELETWTFVRRMVRAALLFPGVTLLAMAYFMLISPSIALSPVGWLNEHFGFTNEMYAIWAFVSSVIFLSAMFSRYADTATRLRVFAAAQIPIMLYCFILIYLFVFKLKNFPRITIWAYGSLWVATLIIFFLGVALTAFFQELRLREKRDD